MPVVARSLVGYPQTISGQTIGAYAMRTYGSASAALTAAEAAGTIKLSTYVDQSAPGQYVPEGISGKAQVSVPLTGNTVTIDDDVENLLIDPAGTIAALTVNMPLAPYDGQEVTLGASQTVTALTMSGNGKTLNGGLTTIGAALFGTWRYKAANTTWYRIG
jgi:hypothetical protein